MYLFQLFGDARDHKTRCTEGCILQERLDLCFILQSALIILASGAQNPDVTFIDPTFLTSFNQGILTKQEISYRTAAKNYHQFHTFKTKQSVEVKIFFSASFQSYLYIQPPYKKYFKSCFTGITRGQRRYVHKKSFLPKCSFYNYNVRLPLQVKMSNIFTRLLIYGFLIFCGEFACDNFEKLKKLAIEMQGNPPCEWCFSTFVCLGKSEE